MLLFENTVMLLCAQYRGKQATFSRTRDKVLTDRIYSQWQTYLCLIVQSLCKNVLKHPGKHIGNTKLYSQI